MNLTYEWDMESTPPELFVHITVTDGRPFSHLADVRRLVPKGTWCSVPPELQPAVGYLLTRAGFEFQFEYPIDGVLHEVYKKVA